MNISELKRLSALIESEAVPTWLRLEIEAHKEDIASKLQKGEQYVVNGPDGQQVIIKPESDKAAA